MKLQSLPFISLYYTGKLQSRKKIHTYVRKNIIEFKLPDYPFKYIIKYAKCKCCKYSTEKVLYWYIEHHLRNRS